MTRSGPINSKPKSGEKYIFWEDYFKRFRVLITISRKKRVHGGRFKTLKEAIRARDVLLDKID